MPLGIGCCVNSTPDLCKFWEWFHPSCIEYGMLPLWSLLGLFSWHPIFQSSHSNSFEDWAPVDEIYGCPIFKCIADTYITGCQDNNSHNGHQVACLIWGEYFHPIHIEFIWKGNISTLHIIPRQCYDLGDDGRPKKDFFQETWKNICIFCHFSTLKWCR